MSTLYKTTVLTSANSGRLGKAARDFCLRIIRDVYGIEYVEEWHRDLDALAYSDEKNWFLTKSAGSFHVVQNAYGVIIATGGLYDLVRKPSTHQRLSERYGDTPVCQIVRVYLDPSVRRQGLGSSINDQLISDARRLGYKALYLHADLQTAGTLHFWADRGYREFGRFSYPSATGTDTSVDFDMWL
ncbi:acetyltransferase (GNAT) family protein [Rhizobium sp. PP-CC-2G-626]|nr:acetyltransferase (GNAT) family protein [Rhizobium sp. PP-CC-2G-626]